MLTKQEHGSVVWIDLESPTKDEAHRLMEEYGIHPAIAEELLLPSVKPKIDRYDNCIYLILHFPAFKHTHKNERDQEIDFIIGKNFLITARYDTVDPMHKFAKTFEVHTTLHTDVRGDHIGLVFLSMIKKLYGALEHELEYMRDSLREAEENIFKGKERAMVIELSSISRELITFKQTLALHKDIIEQFEHISREFFGDQFPRDLGLVQRERVRVIHSLETNLAYLDELRATNNALLSTKQNEIMKVLTILVFIMFPLTLVSGVFGMNTKSTPIVGTPNDFWIIVGMTLVAMFVMFLFFKKYKKWL